MENETTQAQTQTKPIPFRISGDRPALFTALAKARAEFPRLDAGQTADVQKEGRSLYKFDYADLASLQEATVPALSKHGLCISQPWWSEGEGFVVLTLLAHESGASMETETYFERPADWQKLGSALTYVQRYQWRSVCGISASKDDDDANAAVGNSGTTISQRPRTGTEPQVKGGVVDAQLKDIRDLLDEMHLTKAAGSVIMKAAIGRVVPDLAMLTKEEGTKFLQALVDEQRTRAA